jgi:hypothetical protein
MVSSVDELFDKEAYSYVVDHHLIEATWTKGALNNIRNSLGSKNLYAVSFIPYFELWKAYHFGL